jgi:hypothetical protein
MAAIRSAAASILPRVIMGWPMSRRSRAALRPSPDTLNMLSSSGPAARLRILLARAQQRGFQPLDGQSVAALGGVDLCADPVEFAVHVGALDAGTYRDPLERRPRQDHRVPITGGTAGGEQAPPVGLEVFPLGDQDPGLRIKLEELAAELFQHVVGHDDRGLAGQPEPAQLHRAHGHLGGLARAYLVEQADGGFVDDPRDRGDLVRRGSKCRARPGSDSCASS